MNYITKLLLFWPSIIILTLILSIVFSICGWIKLPSIRIIIIGLWIFTIFNCFSSISYSSPNTWWARSIYKSVLPDLKDIDWTITDNSKFDHNQQAIYIWYPHSHFALSAFAIVAGDMGHKIWKRPIAQCSAPPFFDLPAIRHIALAFGLVRSDYDNLKGTLKQGTSLLIIPGGAREVQLAERGHMKLIDGRQGFLRLAQEFGIPIIPVFAFGENEFFQRPVKEHSNIIQKLIKSTGGGMQFPAYSSIKDWFNRESIPLNVFIGPAFRTDGSSLDASANLWKKHVNKFYKKCSKSQNYQSEIEWISKSSL